MTIEEIYHDYLNFLREFTAFKSISTDPSFATDIANTARWLQDQLAANGFKTEFITGYDNPLVVGSYIVDPKLKTILIYGHYDVQPPYAKASEGQARMIEEDLWKAEGWENDPFVLTEKNGRLVARGAVDNKGQIALHLTTVFELIKQKKLNYNIKFLIEGNEETGSPNLRHFIEDHADLLSCDSVLISDGEIASGHPVIEVGFRGVINTAITLTTSDRDLHSGLYGGSVPNAARELMKLIEKLYQGTTTIAIDDFYDDVIAPTKEELKNHASFPFSIEHHHRVTGTKKLFSENSLDFYTQTGLRPSIEITGFESGYNGVGFKNAVPHTASAKLNIRIVPNQDPKKTVKQFEAFVKNNTPSYATVTLQLGQGCKPIRINPKSELATKAAKLLTQEFNKKVLYKYCAATIPIVIDFKEILGVSQVLLPFGNEDCNMHGANENFEIDLIKKDIGVAWGLLS
ncbi:hypothetical protein A3B46_02190 [Candidatus Roizmanbacteria bacterium RIFCSPLOWO2_01_FULL_39_19]|nr:MAG: hypothetical protein A3B46_02190 [Candidatus Roizmanbacteria bacterium RIFCSPLOWO2_01_FULL_39_19]